MAITPTHFVVTVTSAGTSVPLKASTVTTISDRFAARLTIEYDPTNAAGTKFYIGRGTAAGDVTSSTYGYYLDATIPSVTIGLGETRGNGIDMATYRVDSNNSSVKVRCMPEQI